MRNYSLASATLFAILATAQVLRILRQWPVQVAGTPVPMWASACAVVLALSFAVWGYRTAKAAST